MGVKRGHILRGKGINYKCIIQNICSFAFKFDEILSDYQPDQVSLLNRHFEDHLGHNHNHDDDDGDDDREDFIA
jgi:hypothetical protein